MSSRPRTNSQLHKWSHRNVNLKGPDADGLKIGFRNKKSQKEIILKEIRFLGDKIIKFKRQQIVIRIREKSTHTIKVCIKGYINFIGFINAYTDSFFTVIPFDNNNKKMTINKL